MVKSKEYKIIRRRSKRVAPLAWNIWRSYHSLHATCRQGWVIKPRIKWLRAAKLSTTAVVSHYQSRHLSLVRSLFFGICIMPGYTYNPSSIQLPCGRIQISFASPLNQSAICPALSYQCLSKLRLCTLSLTFCLYLKVAGTDQNPQHFACLANVLTVSAISVVSM